ncbi:MAG: hypothetical protein HZB12_00350 [Candidatus Yonathbacteria bacterium]|nr:hypothetical protein [Candidatus Yonathbacteria bacterium]
MNNHFLKINKILVLPMMVAMLFFSASVPLANAFGGVPVGDFPHTLETIGQRLVAIGADIAAKAGEISLDSAAYAVGQALLDQVTNNIVNWAKGGFNGSPVFAVDPGKLFLDTANMVSGGVANDILGAGTCNFDNLFTINLTNSIRNTNHTPSGSSNVFKQQVRCPAALSGEKAQNFYKDFSQGGWSSFQSALSDRGNAFGTNLIVSQELVARQEQVLETKKQELNWGGGFLGMTDTTKCDSMPGEINDLINNPPPKDGAMNYATGNWDYPLTPEEIRSYQDSYCQKSTPGKIVENKLTQALGGDMVRLVGVDRVSKIIGAVITGLSTQAMTGIFSQNSSGANTSAGVNTPAYSASNLGSSQSVIVDTTSASKAVTIPIGQTLQFANKTSCVGSSQCAAFTILLTSGTNSTLNSITINQTGTVNANIALSKLTLYYNTDGNFYNGYTQFGAPQNFTTINAVSGTAVVTDSIPLVPLTTYYFYVGFDAVGADGSTKPLTADTLGFKITGVGVSGATVTGLPKSLIGLTKFVP